MWARRLLSFGGFVGWCVVGLGVRVELLHILFIMHLLSLKGLEDMSVVLSAG